MPEITLREYESEIDKLVEDARYLEAFAHTRHILKQHPRYVGAYYLIGKTLLEADLPELAVDMFRRTLSIDPEHLMARIGLGLAYQRLDHLDGAIWNLERAHELDPSSVELTDELRRLYGRRDGMEPDHIPLNRASLARLYLRGNRTNRAVEELRSLLNRAPDRVDLKLALAEAYWRDAQLVPASDTCQAILDSMRYCLKANLLLGALWVNSGQEEGQVYLDRAQEIDLENTMAHKLFGTESPLKAREAVLQRLVYDPSDSSVDHQSEWFKRLENASVSVGVSEAPTLTEEEVRLVDISAGLESQIEIPDWLRELGGEEEEEEGEEESGLNWLSGFGTDQLMAREEAAAAEASSFKQAEAAREQEMAEEEEVPAWLSGVAQIDETTPATEPEEETPDWIGGLASTEETPEATGEEWLTQLGSEEAEELTSEAEEIPDWLSELKPARTSPTGGISLPSEGVPEWLSTLQTSTEEEAKAAEETPDWLQGLETPSEETTEAAIIEEAAEVESEELPDWLTGFVPEAGTATPTEEVPDWLTEFKPETTEETAFDWEDVESGEEVSAEAIPGEEIADDATFGEAAASEADFNWEALGEDSVDKTQEAEEAVMPEEIPAEAGLPDMLSGDDALTWLSSLAAGKEDELRAQGEADQQARVDEILGRKPTPERAPVEPVEAAPIAPVIPEAEEVPAAAGEDFFGWQAFGEDIAEAGEAPPSGEELGEAAFGEDIVGEETYSEEISAEAAFGEDTFGEEISGESELDWETLGASIDEIPAAEEPTPVAAPADALSGDDALAWLSSLAAGKEDELRAQGEADRQARVDEILGRKPAPERAPVEPAEAAPIAPVIPEAEEVPAAAGEDFFGWQAFGEDIAEAGEALTGEAIEQGAPGSAVEETTIEEEIPAEEAALSDMLSGDDALAWLSDLAAGKEDELRAEAESQQKARVDEILGRKPAPDKTPAKPVEVAPAEPEPATAEVPIEEAAPTDMLSGDDALAWLSGLAAGKEDELRAEAESQQKARVDEILGRKPAPDKTPAKPVEVAPAEPEPATAEVPIEEAAPTDMLSGDDALAWLSDLAAGKEEQLRAEAESQQKARVDEILGRKPAPDKTPAKPVEVAPAEPEPATAEVPVEEAAPTDMLSGDDALAWLSGLAAGKEEQLRAEAESQQKARVDEILGRKPAPDKTPAKPEPAAVPPAKPAVEEIPSEEATPADMLSGDDALAWLSNLAAGKEDQLRAEGEAEKQARVNELLGRTPTRPLPAETLEEITPTPAPTREEPKPPTPRRARATEDKTRPAPSQPAAPKRATEDKTRPAPSQPTAPKRAAEDKTRPPAPKRAAEDITPPAAAPAADNAIPGARLGATEFNALRDHVEKNRDDNEAQLKLARALWARGEIKESMAHYTRLTRSDLNSQVIEDLEHYRQTQPNATVLRTLGDAYMKAGSLDEALAAYSQAMSAL